MQFLIRVIFLYALQGSGILYRLLCTGAQQEDMEARLSYLVRMNERETSDTSLY
jgi:hypothetical protein